VFWLIRAVILDEWATYWKERLDSSDVKDQQKVNRAFYLYHKRHVQWSDEHDSLFLQFQVDDYGTKFTGSIDVDDFYLSRCDCKEPDCPHLLAAFFSLYSRSKSVTRWIEEWKKSRSTTDIFSQLQRSSTWLKQKEQRFHSHSVEAWNERLTDAFATYDSAVVQKNPYLLMNLLDSYFLRIRQTEPVEEEMKKLYRLYSVCWLLHQLREETRTWNFSKNELERSVFSHFHYLVEMVEKAVNNLPHPLPFSFDPFLSELRTWARDFIAWDDDLFPFYFDVYRFLWTDVFTKATWRQEELETLQDLWMPNILANIHHSLLLKNDDLAEKFFSLAAPDVLYYVSWWIEWLASLNDSKRMSRLLTWIEHSLESFLQTLETNYLRTRYIQSLLQQFIRYGIVNEHPKQMERLMRVTLPYSYYYYSDLLYEQGAYQQWVELQLYMGHRADDLPTEEIRKIQKEAPELLLPLYHDTVHYHVNQRTRQHYKLAVKYIKKLHTIYKKLKRLDQWELFLTTLQEETKRLRAFQEELERGKLTHVNG
jgi:hypothetical protein